LVNATISDDETLKIGSPNPSGWLGYWNTGTLFIKEASYDPAASYYDFGSSSQIYANAQFLELETLSPIAHIQPGATLTHRETWRVYATDALSRPTA
jgi:hypothetical protein